MKTEEKLEKNLHTVCTKNFILHLLRVIEKWIVLKDFYGYWIGYNINVLLCVFYLFLVIIYEFRRLDERNAAVHITSAPPAGTFFVF